MKAASGKASSSSHQYGSVSPKSLTAAGPDDFRNDAQPGPDQEPSLATAASTSSSISPEPVATGSLRASGWQQGSQSSMIIMPPAGRQQQNSEMITAITSTQQWQQGLQHLQPSGSGVTAVPHSGCYQSGFGLSAQGLAAAAEVVARHVFPAAKAVKQKIEGWVEKLKKQKLSSAPPSPPFAEVQLLAAALQAAAQAIFAAVPNRYGCNNPACFHLTTVSDAFALVRGKSCVCGGCLSRLDAGEGAVELPAARWARHWQCQWFLPGWSARPQWSEWYHTVVRRSTVAPLLMCLDVGSDTVFRSKYCQCHWQCHHGCCPAWALI